MRRALVLAVVLLACSTKESAPASSDADAGACTSADFDGAPLGVHCNALVDTSGRTVLLHGVNARVAGVFDVTFDDGRAALEPVPAFTLDDARRMRALGFNALRLPIDWSAIEPTETGGFDEKYLDRVAAVVDACRQAGVYVLLDIHEDAFSKEIGEDGAPLWAIVPPPTQKLGGPMNDLGARRASKQVTDAFATFFGPSADGARLRDRFGKMAAHVAARFADDDRVVGLELFNEPIASDAEVLAFHQQVLPMVRAAAPKKLVFFEPPATRNIIDKASTGTASLGAGTVYAPHVYTFAFTGTADSHKTITKEQLAPSNESARAEADGWQAPLVITELGFSPSETVFANYMRWQAELQDEQRASAFLWVWKEDSQGSWGLYDFDANHVATERPQVVAALARVRLEAAAGRLVSVKYDADAKRFEARFVGDAATTAPSLVSLGSLGTLASGETWRATCDGNAVSAIDPAAEPLAIPCGGAGAHVLVLTPK